MGRHGGRMDRDDHFFICRSAFLLGMDPSDPAGLLALHNGIFSFSPGRGPGDGALSPAVYALLFVFAGSGRTDIRGCSASGHVAPPPILLPRPVSDRDRKSTRL